MIPVRLAPEPANFASDVRQPGLCALAELVGESSPTRTGPKRQKLAEHRDDIPPEELPPYWRRAHDDLLRAYHRLCAYTALYIYPITGAHSVDHMLAKSNDWRQVYEWSNYRLACARINSRKGIKSPIDPFEVEDSWFELELVGYQVLPGESAPGGLRGAITATIDALNLNGADLRAARSEYAEEYLLAHISFDFLRRHAPFVARELQRQGRLLPADRPAHE